MLEGTAAKEPPCRYQTLSDFNGTSIASLTGTIFSDYIDKRVANVTHLHFNDYSSMTEALRGGKIDAIAIDEPVGRLLVYKCPDVVMFKEIVVHDTYGYAFKKGSPLRSRVDQAIEAMRRNGTLDKIASDWFDHPQEDRRLPTVKSIRPDFTGKAGVFRFGHDQVNPPMSYVASNETRGSDVELALRIATALDMELKCVPMNFDALIEAVQAGKVDMVGGSMSITAERQKSVDFSVPYYNGGLALLVLRSGKTNISSRVSFMDSISISFTRTFIDEGRYLLILKGLWVTVVISVMAAIWGTLL
ncbi:MAG: transporter substrate-binding domain-containing protein, partial [Thermoguttaceae bacterium]|nr:transporter substrate-binding domain-containing protein [Thermoguttaceae bacterium]